MPNVLPREMTADELKSMLKSNIHFKSLGGVRVPGLKLGEEDMKWWRDAKIGMFIHWGLYSILGRGEWVRFNEHLSKEEYEGLKEQFDPKDFNMNEWADIARDMGANYAVMVTRHHDGFALWDSESSYEGFTSMNAAAHRDFVKEYTEAFRRAGLRVGYYYSPMDWRFPGYFDPEGLRDNAELMKKQCYGQVEELMTKYGTPDILWYDGGWLAHKGSDTTSAWFWEPGKLNTMVRSHAPKAIINPRSGWEGDFMCDEGSHEIYGGIINLPWEKNMCVCSGRSWGWMPTDPVSDLDWLIKMVADAVIRDGNMLLNIGPDKNGKIAPEIRGRIRELGSWLRAHGEAIYCTRGGPIEPVDNVFGATCNLNRLYLHVQDPAAFRDIVLKDVPGEILYATAFDGGEVKIEKTADGVKVLLPENAKGPDFIVRLTLDREIRVNTSQVYFKG